MSILTDARERAKGYEFGDEITNICAGHGNPTRHCFYVSHGKNTVKCTNKKGKFWETGIEVIYKGTLSEDECKRLFEPVWNARFGGVNA